MLACGSPRGSSLIAQKTCLIDLDRPLVGYWIVTILQPVLNQLQIVADTARVNANPMDTLNQQSLQPILFQSSTAEIEVP